MLLTGLTFASAAHAYVYWSSSQGMIGRADLDGSNATNNFVNATEPVAVVVNGQHVYWPDFNDGTIGRSNLDGSGVNQNFITGVRVGPIGPSGVAIDGQHIYWTSSTAIGRANLDGTDVNPSFITGLNNAFGIAVDAQHIYWTDDAGAIGRANLDGTDANLNFITGAGEARGIAVGTQHIYWANNNGPNTIGRANLDGTDANLNFITGVSALAVAVDAQHIYWPDEGPMPTADTIGRANLDGSAINNNFITGVTVPDAVAVDTADLPSAASPPVITSSAAEGQVVITGSVEEGQVLADQHGTWTNTPNRFTYQWLRCDPTGANCAAIPGATSQSYQTTPADLGTTIRVQETAANASGAGSPATSTPTGIVTGAAPASQAAPSITGSAIVGLRLSEVHGLWTNTPTSYTYEWLRCQASGTTCTAIPNARTPTYQVTAADVGFTVRVQEVAANVFGSSGPAVSSATARVPKPPALRASVTSVSTAGPTAMVTISCRGPVGADCAGRITLSARARARGHTVVAVNFRQHTELISLAHGTFSVPVGGRKRVPVALDQAGRRLLGEFYTLPARLVLSGNSGLTRTITFAYPRVGSLIRYTAAFAEASTTIQAFSVIGLPHLARVGLRCRGAGCPFTGRTIHPKRAKVTLTDLFRDAHLRPRTTITATVAAPNMIGEVEVIQIRAGAAPLQTDLCLAPGTTSPQPCR